MRHCCILLLVCLAAFPSSAKADVTSADKQAIRQNIKIIEQLLDVGNSAGIKTLVSPQASPDLINEIEDDLGDKKIHFRQDNIDHWKAISPSSVEVRGSFSASSPGWSISGASDRFIFENYYGHWMLLDMNFHRKLNPAYVWKTIKNVMSIVFVVFAFTFAFWVWMLVDCLNKPSKDKLIWVLMVIFLNLLGALLYFFIEFNKKSTNNSQPVI